MATCSKIFWREFQRRNQNRTRQRQEFLAVLLDTIHEEMNSARKEPSVPSVPEITIPNDIIQESGSPDSAFLSAGSSTDNQVRFSIPISKW